MCNSSSFTIVLWFYYRPQPVVDLIRLLGRGEGKNPFGPKIILLSFYPLWPIEEKKHSIGRCEGKNVK